MKQGQFPAILPLASLNGKNGFKLDGEAAIDFSGWPVSAAGDINGDGVSDLLIGAHGHASGTGRSYVVFGGPEVGISGLIALSGLNGSTGFKLDGESGGNSGLSVSTAGDINADGVSDILIGAPWYASQKGRSYVVFGGSGVGGSGLVTLSALNGSNGFKLDGEATNDHSGYSVSTAGDINGDGVSDLLIGAPGYASQKGRSYVVFGGQGVGSAGLIALSGLTGSNGFKLDGELANDYSGFPVSAAGDVNGDGISDLLVGAPYRANYTGRSYVVF
ncbi:MAG: FG-GAP repeat protein, partial [Proteobacteria bacterium]|nr:FG-GAP repeat protein [Pseudomonadota bacterium]